MRNLSEVEAAQILGEIARERVAAGRPQLTEGQAAQILRAHRQVRRLPEVRSLPEASEQPTTARMPQPPRSSRLRVPR